MGNLRRIRKNLEHKSNEAITNKKATSSSKDNDNFYDPIKEAKEKQKRSYIRGRNYHPKYNKKTLG